ncbi:MAG: hypothetical protein KAQ67_07395 [Gammaproteobacteria bacterium]|nr:hypothetical protein [Gammaproteobacteria bacterium]
MELTAENFAAAASTCAFLFSIATLFISRSMQHQARTRQSASESLTGFASLEQMIKDVPTVLKFHGITDKELEIAGVTAKELSYFLSNMTTGGIYYRTTAKTGLIQFFGENGYYGEMFKHEATRNAWAICRRCLAPSDYRMNLDRLCILNDGPLPELSDYLERINKKRPV